MPDAPTVQVTRPSEAERPGFDEAGVFGDGEAMEGKLVVLSNRLESGTDGPQQHVHADMAKVFHVIEGTLRISMAEETFNVGAGDVLSVPAGMPHTYGNPFDEAAAFMTVMSDD
jgi:quercetin dioxygenase-like cupin family protein